MKLNIFMQSASTSLVKRSLFEFETFFLYTWNIFRSKIEKKGQLEQKHKNTLYLSPEK